MSNELTKEQQEELKKLAEDILQEAKKVKEDYEENPSDASGSVHPTEGKVKGVGVMVEANHMCACVRGVKHDSTMKTARVSGCFLENEDNSRAEFYSFIRDLK